MIFFRGDANLDDDDEMLKKLAGLIHLFQTLFYRYPIDVTCCFRLRGGKRSR